MDSVRTPTDKPETPVEFPDRTLLYWLETPNDDCSTVAVRDDTAAAALNLDDPDEHWFIPNDLGALVYTWAGLLQWLSDLELKLDDAARGNLGTVPAADGGRTGWVDETTGLISGPAPVFAANDAEATS